MPDITIEELEKAARNIERISSFIGERRDWIVGEGGEAKATAIRGSAKALSQKLVEATGTEPDSDFMIKLPTKLEPSAKISAARLSKFADFLDQLHAWFSSQNEAEVPDDSAPAVEAIHGSRALVFSAGDSAGGEGGSGAGTGTGEPGKSEPKYTDEQYQEGINAVVAKERARSERHAKKAAEETIRAWLSKITVNLCLDWLRRRKFRGDFSDENRESQDGLEYQIPDPNPDPLEKSLSVEMQARVRKAISTLAPKYRAVVILRDLEGLSYREIGEMLNVEISKVKSNLFRGRRELKEILRPFFEVGG